MKTTFKTKILMIAIFVLGVLTIYGLTSIITTEVTKITTIVTTPQETTQPGTVIVFLAGGETETLLTPDEVDGIRHDDGVLVLSKRLGPWKVAIIRTYGVGVWEKTDWKPRP